MKIDYEAWRFWVSITQTLVTVAIAIYVWLVTKDRVTNKRITDLDSKLSQMLDAFKAAQSVKCAEHQQRTTSLEVSIKNAPTHQDLGEIHEKINDVFGQMKELLGQTRANSVNIRMLVDHHLKGDNK